MRKLLTTILMLCLPSLLAPPRLVARMVGTEAIIGAPAPGTASVVQPTSTYPLAAGCSTYNNGGGNATTCAYPVNVTAGNEAYVLVIGAGGAGTISAVSCAGTATVGTFSTIGAGATLGGAVAQWYSAAITSSGSCTVSATYSAGANVAVFPYEVSNSNGPDSGVNPVYSSNTTNCTACSMALS